MSAPFYTTDLRWSIRVDTDRMIAWCQHTDGSKVALSLVHIAYA